MKPQLLLGLLPSFLAPLAMASASQLGEKMPPPQQKDIPPFQVTGFYAQVYPAEIDNVWEYWVEANITIQPGEGAAWCYAWANTTSPTVLASEIPTTPCTQDGSISWWFDPPPPTSSNGSATVPSASNTWTYGVSWNESERSVLTGIYTGTGTDFGLGTTSARTGAGFGNVTLIYFAGNSTFSMPVTQTTSRGRAGRRGGMYAGGMQRLS